MEKLPLVIADRKRIDINAVTLEAR